MSHEQELAKDGLLDVVNRQLLVGGGLKAFDGGPEEIEGLFDSGLFGSGEAGDLTAGVKAASMASAPLRCGTSFDL